MPYKQIIEQSLTTIQAAQNLAVEAQKMYDEARKMLESLKEPVPEKRKKRNVLAQPDVKKLLSKSSSRFKN